MVAAAIGGAAVAGLAGSAISAGAASDAAQTQADAANNSAALQNAQWQQTQKNLKPYMDLGTSAINPLLSAMGYNVTKNSDGTYTFGSTDPNNPLQQKFTAPTAAQAAATPGYQFTLDQGLKSVQNSAAARGLGTSGAALKGASTYATGLADSTYNDVFNRALQTFNANYNSAANNVNRLSGLVGNGQNAAATNGSLGAAAAGNIGNTLMSGANASASGTVGAANALSSGLSSLGSAGMTYGLLNNNALANATAANPTYGTTSAGNPIYFQV
ncbi:DNA transfer protein p32 [Burkholderia multivorans]|uniref:DNA transfer protein p32 n=1 Tax=Burkholderia multivorans TaxID=87883 RepID=UPI00159274EE|nr:DNA transfer protein p32 [Burkholderia multivorans]